ncbi:glycosyltransferase [Epilithonimonas xixisoli]|uniref:Glycosyltransferase involved in cell wall biosynthesis n=1 Tax=Epilithonimonas xixisoli TaxID=1476462 RepID=A0A4R8IF96_9FLAO|nr:glycosyltransferase [Epilithonimonas xixisoli]TDX84094.1 glycosyltransferase involved in cell wall biosynthesis [Epilithonimonas xixisoli]
MENKIKILHILESVTGGGVEKRRLSLAKLLDKNKFTQVIICSQALRYIPEEIRKNGVEIIEIGELGSPFNIKLHKKVQKIIDDYRPDIIHGAVFEGVTLAAVNGWLRKVPIIIIEETSDPQNRSWKGDFLMKIFAKLSDKIVGVSEGITEEYLKEKLKIPACKVQLINNGVVLPREVNNAEISNAKLQFNIQEKDFVIGSVGRMLSDEHKRFSDLIDAFAIFAKNKTNVKLLLIGEGPEKAKYLKKVAELDIKDKVIFAGYQADVTLFYKLMNVFSLVSAREAFGLVLAEAMLNNLPIVATRVGGMKYIVDDNKTGFLIEKSDVTDLALKFNILYNDSNLREKFSRAGFEKAVLEYTEENYVQKVANLYDELLTARKIKKPW